MKSAVNLNGNINYKTLGSVNYLELMICAKEFIELIDNFMDKFKSNRFVYSAAYLNNTLIGILVAQDKSKMVNKFEKILPSICIYLIYVVKDFRGQNVGRNLLLNLINNLRGKFATIYTKLPLKYKKGIDFYLRNNFHRVQIQKNKIILEHNLWNDFGLRDCKIIEEDFSLF